MFGREQRNVRTAREQVAALRKPGESEVLALGRATSGTLRSQGGRGIEPVVVAVTDQAVYRTFGTRSPSTMQMPISSLSFEVRPYYVGNASKSSSVIALFGDDGSHEFGWIESGWSEPASIPFEAESGGLVGQPTIHPPEAATTTLIKVMAIQFKAAGREFSLQ